MCAGAAGAGDGVRVERVQPVDGGRGAVPGDVRFIARPDDGVAQERGEVRAQGRLLHATNVTVFPQLEFKVAGTYYLEVLVDDVMKLRYIPLVVVPPPERRRQRRKTRRFLKGPRPARLPPAKMTGTPGALQRMRPTTA